MNCPLCEQSVRDGAALAHIVICASDQKNRADSLAQELASLRNKYVFVPRDDAAPVVAQQARQAARRKGDHA